MNKIDDRDLRHLRRCIELAKEALSAGNQPFGSVLVSAQGEVMFEGRNEVMTTGDQTRHPEFEIARWAATYMTPEDRAKAIVYTSGEHCAMCSAAHGWVGLGRIVYVSSTEQLSSWLKEIGVAASPVKSLPINQVVPEIEVYGPVPGLAEEIRELHVRFHKS
ncbi:nucleoside deaminase [Gelidibacter sp.]|uniref:nucleoside deaminase n=1 Tax=Gelidibacter sp. TaxID=2018083 RepID=UPI002CF3E1E4|nr:nucleoside deaminase [Gelidibacter sp.]HUH29213.1 nucleoside deaminase [Gelidibacter sp.]